MSGPRRTGVELLDELIERHGNWGRWGADDQIGTANLITRSVVRDAARGVRHGHVVGLSIGFGPDGPQTGANGRINCMRTTLATGTDHVTGAQQWSGAPFPHDMGYSDDLVVLPLQSATHWDSLSHIFHDKFMYNGFPASDSASGGSGHNGVEHLAASLVGRGVLLDVPDALGQPWLADGHAITVHELETTIEAARVEVRPGDILLLRTGQLARCRAQGWGTYAGGPAPGLGLGTIPWLAERQIAAVASDTWGVEVRPNEIPGAFQPFHLVTVVYMGLLLGEMFDFDELAVACREAGRHDMLLAAAPLSFAGAAGAPPGPVAIL
jgi:kynurenine formamidase